MQKTPIRYRKRRRDPVTGEFTDEPPDSGGILEFFNFSGTYEEEREVGSTWWSRATNWTGRAPEETHNTYRDAGDIYEYGYPREADEWVMSSPFRLQSSSKGEASSHSFQRRGDRGDRGKIRVSEGNRGRGQHASQFSRDDDGFGLHIDDVDDGGEGTSRGWELAPRMDRRPQATRGNPLARRPQQQPAASGASRSRRTPSPARGEAVWERDIEDNMGRL